MNEVQNTAAGTPKQCFVVMGFGTKTDLATGRKLNLDKSYQALIKPVVESKGIVCLRADEIKHSGTIDVPMFQELFTADMVIADLSTANVNAFYELGVRHALRPHTTIIMSEAQLNYPFDVNHIAINRYTHLGDNIDYFEVLRFQKLLSETIDAVLDKSQVDSPVYTFLEGLLPPSLQEKATQVARQVGDALANASSTNSQHDDQENQTLSLLVKQAEEAIGSKRYEQAKSLLNSALLISQLNAEDKNSSGNTYLIQRLVLATYKSKKPDEITALNDAMALLDKIDLAHTNDPETVALAGAIEKKLYECNDGDHHIDNAILFFQRGYYLLHNRYNGINLAYLLLCRAHSSLETSPDDKIADTIWANRIYRDVLAICEKEWQQIQNRSKSADDASEAELEQITATQKVVEDEQRFWILVNKAEAHFALGEEAPYNAAKDAAAAIDHEEWMTESFTQQVDKIAQLLKK
ncbi:MAG: DUF4071 domain-containing protein [Williamsia sp.]|nr:DUF4071 domain-containing protein [Williamsia sp.]